VELNFAVDMDLLKDKYLLFSLYERISRNRERGEADDCLFTEGAQW